MSSAHPGNPCLADQYAQARDPGLYLNTGYDPSYTDSNHTTASCASQSQAIIGTSDQKAAWAVGCSEAQGDYGYVSSKGITRAATWWLDVETANSWCGLHGVSCDVSLNQYTIQGIIDTLTHIGAVPVGVYSTNTQWGIITNNYLPAGVTADWYATAGSTAAAASKYCSDSSYGFTHSHVALVQFIVGSLDEDYAC